MTGHKAALQGEAAGVSYLQKVIFEFARCSGMTAMKRRIRITIFVVFILTAAYGICSVYLNRQQAQAEAVAEELVWAPLPAGTVWENVSSCYAGRCLLQGRGEDGSVLWAVLRLDGVVETLLPKAIGVTHVTYAGDGILESNFADGTESYSYLGSVPIEESQYAGPYSLRWSADSWHTKETEAGWRICSRQFLYASPQAYDWISPYWDDWAVACIDGTCQILRGTEEVADCALQSLPAAWRNPIVSEGFLRFTVPRRGGSGVAFLQIAENRALDRDGLAYDDARDFSEGLAAVKLDGKWGYIDTQERLVISPQYLHAFDFSDGMACVVDEKGQAYFIDRENRTCSEPFAFEDDIRWIGQYHDGIYVVANQFDVQLRAVDDRRNLPDGWMMDVQYEDGVWCCESRFRDDEHNTLESGVYFPQADVYAEGTGRPQVYHSAVVLETDGKTRLYDKATGTVLCAYDVILEYSNGLAAVQDGRTTGYIDARGNLVLGMLPQEYGTFFRQFSNELAPLSIPGQFGYIVHPLLYDRWTWDEQQRAAVRGLTVTDSQAPLTYPVLWERLAELTAVQYRTVETLGTDGPALFAVDVSAIQSHLEQSGFPAVGTVDRQHLAVAIAAIADACGLITDGWLPLYADRSEIAPLCEAAVGYACAIGLFDVDAVGCMEPGKTVSEADLSIYALRFLENSVNWQPDLR